MHLTNILLVGVGGFLGSAARYGLGVWMLHLAPQQKFPIGTFLVNLSGCLLIGLLAGLAGKHGVFGQETRLFLFTGVLGGFTTFSAFGLEAVTLLRRGELLIAAGYVGGSVLLGIGAVWLGLRMVEWMPR